MNILIKLQKAIKYFLHNKIQKEKYKSAREANKSHNKTDEKGVKYGYHRPNQSSVRFKSHQSKLSIDKENVDLYIKYNLNENDKKYVENYRIENAIYTGEIIQGMRHGKGVQIWDDGAKYDGEWKFDKANGQGTFYHIDGDIYQGEWVDDRANGEGTYINADGATYQGQWKDDIQDGYGTEIWNDRSSYKGYYIKGKKQGWGLYKWADGNQYEGEWWDNKINGKVYLFII